MEDAVGKVKLICFCIFEDSPEYHCKESGSEWSRKLLK